MVLERPEGHIHEYVRNKKNKSIFRCAHPRCSHYQRVEYLEGKEALCTQCKHAFILDRIQLRNMKPRCEMCQETARGRALRASIEKLNLNLALAPPDPIVFQAPVELPTEAFSPLTYQSSTTKEVKDVHNSK